MPELVHASLNQQWGGADGEYTLLSLQMTRNALFAISWTMERTQYKVGDIVLVTSPFSRMRGQYGFIYAVNKRYGVMFPGGKKISFGQGLQFGEPRSDRTKQLRAAAIAAKRQYFDLPEHEFELDNEEAEEKDDMEEEETLPDAVKSDEHAREEAVEDTDSTVTEKVDKLFLAVEGLSTLLKDMRVTTEQQHNEVAHLSSFVRELGSRVQTVETHLQNTHRG